MGKVQILAVLTMDGCLSSELYDKARSDRNICVEIRDPMTEKAAVRLANKELDQKAQKKQMIVFKSGE